MTELSIDAAREAKDEARQGNLRENDAGVPDELQIDYEENSPEQVKLHPEVLVTFDHIARISINTYGNDENLLAMEQNLQGAPPYGYDVALTVADPEVVDGQVWDPASDDEWAETRVLGDPESDDNPYELRESIVKDDDGEITGSEIDGVGELPGGNSWDGQPRANGFEDTDYIEIQISASRAADVLGALDTAGMWFSGQDGDIREGLFEAPPELFADAEYDSDEHGYPRLTGYPELRADMVDQRGAITCIFGEDEPDTRSAIEVDIYSVNGGALDALVPLTPEDDAYAKPTYPRKNNLFWEENGGSGHEQPDDVGADAEPQSDMSMQDAQDALSGDEVTYGDLSDDGQEFVDTAVTVVEEQGLDSITELDSPDNDTQHDTFEERVVTDSRDFVATPAELSEIVDEEASA